MLFVLYNVRSVIKNPTSVIPTRESVFLHSFLFLVIHCSETTASWNLGFRLNIRWDPLCVLIWSQCYCH